MEDENLIAHCDKCEQMFPTIIVSCVRCCKETSRIRGCVDTLLSRNLCFECFRELDEKAWRYDEACK